MFINKKKNCLAYERVKNLLKVTSNNRAEILEGHIPNLDFKYFEIKLFHVTSIVTSGSRNVWLQGIKKIGLGVFKIFGVQIFRLFSHVSHLPSLEKYVHTKFLAFFK